MKLTNWGKYPVIDTQVLNVSSLRDLKTINEECTDLIARGLGRCYGDSSLAQTVLSTTKLNRMISFNAENGMLCCESGVPLSDILSVFVPRGWFLPVTPGTKFITVGGAIASDVHGKNHHKDGSFSEHVESIDLLLSNGTVVKCSPYENADLFRTTCGGMGLTGIILNATFHLKRIETAYIKQRTIKAMNLDEILELFKQYHHYTYSVAWIDCLARGRNLGKSILILGEHALSHELVGKVQPEIKLNAGTAPKLNIPLDFPNFILNNVSINLFNLLFYNLQRAKMKETIVHYEPFFYPLDSILNWNRIYGKRGFTQYQFVLPKTAGKAGLKNILTEISDRGLGSFLAVLKVFGKGNDNLLSFPMEGLTLALDFPITPRLFPFLDELDKIVLDHGGRLYLSKDVRMSADMFNRSYANANEFVILKNRIDAEKKYQSLQSKRIGV